MIKYLLSTILFLCVLQGISQNIEVRYKVIKKIYNTDMNGSRKEIATLQFNGFLYQKKNRTIYFQRPLYLNDYPTGSIDIQVNDHYTIGTSIPMDTLFHVYYVDFDSLITRSRVEFTGLNGGSMEWNMKQKFNKGMMIWKLLPDTKEINGLSCQRATFTAPDGRLIYDVWFCTDINVLAGVGTITNLPGLVVEAYNPVYDETYTLISYNTNASFPDSIFWPGIFNGPFK